MPPSLGLGLDLGTSGARLALMEVTGDTPAVLRWEQAIPYPGRFEDPESWRRALATLMAALATEDRQRVGAIAIDGTSGTLLLCRPDGSLPGAALASALPYHHACPGQQAAAAALVDNQGPAASASGSLARALELLERARAAGIDGPLWLRHQADWLMGWLLGSWRWGEEGNNLRLGWDLRQQRWSGSIASQSWAAGLPEICPSGRVLGPLGAEAAT